MNHQSSIDTIGNIVSLIFEHIDKEITQCYSLFLFVHLTNLKNEYHIKTLPETIFYDLEATLFEDITNGNLRLKVIWV